MISLNFGFTHVVNNRGWAVDNMN